MRKTLLFVSSRIPKRIAAKVRLEDRSTFAWRQKGAKSPRDSQTPDRPRFRNKTQRRRTTQPHRRESRKFQHVGEAPGRVVELVRSKRAHERGNRNRRQNQ